MGTHDATRALWASTFLRLARVRRRVEAGRTDPEADVRELLDAVHDASAAAWAGYQELSDRLDALEERQLPGVGEAVADR